MCSICNKFETTYLNIEQGNLLPYEIKNAPDNTTFTNIINKNSGIISLLRLIVAIAVEITEVISFGKATANAFSSAKNLSEQNIHNRKLEAAAKYNKLVKYLCDAWWISIAIISAKCRLK